MKIYALVHEEGGLSHFPVRKQIRL